jgi:processive 1,2-diacylglycerol beta-glucosyltransferase
MKKKIVFLSADMGQGHNSAVQAIQEALEQYYPGKFEQEVIDVVALVGPTIDKFIERLYEKSAMYSKPAYKAFFEFTNKSEIGSFLDKKGYFMVKTGLKSIIDEKPDMVISCFPFLSYSVSRYLKEHHFDVPFLSLITDTGEVHSDWACKTVDYFFSPSWETTFYLEKKGVKADKIKTFGFPVKQSFYQDFDKKEIRQKNKIPEDKKVILYFTGAWGMGKVIDKVIRLDDKLDNIVLLVVTGKNEKLKDRLSEIKYKNDVRLLGYIHNVAEMLSITDLVVAKAGGIQTMEIVTAKKPSIITEVVPGQEEPNARFIEAMGFGYVEKKPTRLALRAKYIIETDELARLQKNLDKYHVNEGSDKKIADFIAGVLKVT